jgi:TRAP-type uncharacterized transport system substrate-binding protein
MISIADQVRTACSQLLRGLDQEVQGWLRIIHHKRVLLVASLIALAWLVAALRPVPPSSVSIASGQAGSAYDRLSRGLAAEMADQGLRLKLVPTSGQVEGFEKLSDERSAVGASLMTAGTFTSEDAPDLRSLGSVGLAAMMLFHRGAPLTSDDPFAALEGKTIAIGPEGSVSNRLFHIVDGLNRAGGAPRGRWIELPNADAAAKLIAGEIDAMFLVDAFESETVQRLLADPGLCLHDFTVADAYIKKLPFLEKVVIPKASIDLDRIRPDRDVTLLASTINLLVEKNTHPAVQWGLLIAAREAAFNDESFFAEGRDFPRHGDGSFPLSSVAKRFYASGVPEYFDSLPLWLATLLNQVWAYLVAFFLLVNPLWKKISSFRSFNSDYHVDYFYKTLREFGQRLKSAKTPEHLGDLIKRTEKLEALMDASWFDDSHTPATFALESSLRSIRKRAEEQLARITGGPAPR